MPTGTAANFALNHAHVEHSHARLRYHQTAVDDRAWSLWVCTQLECDRQAHGGDAQGHCPDAHGGVVDLVGHSMGGKAAMTLALSRPEQVARLLVADIAPVTYGHSQQQFIDAMRAVDLSKVTRRADAVAQLARHVEDKTLQSFFTQSLDVQGRRWHYNLDALERDMPKILSFPELSSTYDGLTLFLSGANSDYVLPSHRDKIKTHFSTAKFAKIQDAGHWLHAEQPRAFEASLRAFLDYQA